MADNELRRKIRTHLLTNKRANLYDTLGVPPTSTDAEIATRIAVVQSESTGSGCNLNAEIKYAIGTLGNDVSRREYDEKLFEQLKTAAEAPLRTDAGETATSGGGRKVGQQWSAAQKIVLAMGVAIAIAFGFLIKGMLDARVARKYQEDTIRIQHEILQAKENEAKQQAERISSSTSDQAHLANRVVGVFEQNAATRQYEAGRRADTQAAVIEMRQEEQKRRLATTEEARRKAEEREQQAKGTAEARYWSCVRSWQDRGKTSDEAFAACSSYKRY